MILCGVILPVASFKAGDCVDTKLWRGQEESTEVKFCEGRVMTMTEKMIPL